MIFFAGQVWFPRVGDPDLTQREIRKQLRQEEPAGQVLQPFLRMRYRRFKGNPLQKKRFRFCYMPDRQARGRVNTMLIK